MVHPGSVHHNTVYMYRKYQFFFVKKVIDLINIKIPKEFINEYLITITDCVGNIIYKKIGTKNKEVQTDLIDIKNLRSGAYILQFSNKDQKIIRKLLKL